MKLKIKNILFGGSIFYVITVIVLMLFSLFTSVMTVELNDSDENLNKINQYRQEVLSITNAECATVINNMIDFYEKTSYTGEVSLKDMNNYFVNEVDGYLHFYTDVKEKCNLTEEEIQENFLLSKFLNISVGIDQFLNYYYFQYELSFWDYFTRQSMEIKTLNIDYNIRKSNELEIISTMIKLCKEGNEDNE